MKVTVIPMVVGALGTASKRLDELDIRGKIETIQTMPLRFARILRRVLEAGEDLLSLRLQFDQSTGTVDYTGGFYAER